MNFKLRKKFKAQLGASMIEYAIFLSIILAIFVIANQILLTAVDTRSQAISESHESMVGCNSNIMTGEQCL